MKKLYVVTGANGHLGSTILRKLIQSGEKVRGLILPAESPFFPEEAEYVKGDVTDVDSLRPLFSNPDGSAFKGQRGRDEKSARARAGK